MKCLSTGYRMDGSLALPSPSTLGSCCFTPALPAGWPHLTASFRPSTPAPVPAHPSVHLKRQLVPPL